jgi:acyl dehydratase
VYAFAGITGDFYKHTTEAYMHTTQYGARIAHGVLLLGYVSTVSGQVADLFGERLAVTYGYDRVRFIKPVFFGDTITVRHEITEYDVETDFFARVTITNQRSEVVAAAVHIIKVL